MLFSITSLNNSNVNLYEPFLISHVIKLLIIYAGRMDNCSEHLKSQYSIDITPIGAHLYFLLLVYSLAADSLINTR